MVILGLCGEAGSGKDYIGQLLHEKYNYTKIAFADKVKRVVQDIFEFTDEQLWGPSEMRNLPDKRYLIEGSASEYLTARFALIQFGTEAGRKCFPNIWVHYTLQLAQKILKESNLSYSPQVGIYPSDNSTVNGVIITDVRFKNEFNAIKDVGGKIIKILRPEHPSSVANTKIALHSSETEQKEIPNEEFDYILINSSDPLVLNKNISDMALKLMLT